MEFNSFVNGSDFKFLLIEEKNKIGSVVVEERLWFLVVRDEDR